MKHKALYGAALSALALSACQGGGQVKVIDAHYISPAHPVSQSVETLAVDSTVDKATAEKYKPESVLDLPVYYTIQEGYLKDEVERLRVRLGLKKVVWHNSIPTCLDWPIHASYRLDVSRVEKALGDFFDGYPLVPAWYQRDGVLQILPLKPFYQNGECDEA